MKVVLLAGGTGTRISEESTYRPKPMIQVGGMPIIWHIMKEYSYFGFNDFIICAGYMQEYIKEWFSRYFMNTHDVTFDYTKDGEMTVHQNSIEPWKVTICDTGLDTMTGGRIKRIQPYIGNETFLMTYGDGVCDVNIAKLVEFHKTHGKIATLTSVIKKEDKGVLDITDYGIVRSFREKNNLDGKAINAGYMVLEPKIFDYIEGDNTVFESEPLNRLVSEGELMSYKHEGFWQCMDTIYEKEQLEKLWKAGAAPWKIWE